MLEGTGEAPHSLSTLSQTEPAMAFSVRHCPLGWAMDTQAAGAPTGLGASLGFSQWAGSVRASSLTMTGKPKWLRGMTPAKQRNQCLLE